MKSALSLARSVGTSQTSSSPFTVRGAYQQGTPPLLLPLLTIVLHYSFWKRFMKNHAVLELKCC